MVNYANLGCQCRDLVCGHPSLSVVVPLGPAATDLWSGGGFVSDRLQQHRAPPPHTVRPILNPSPRTPLIHPIPPKTLHFLQNQPRLTPHLPSSVVRASSSLPAVLFFIRIYQE